LVIRNTVNGVKVLAVLSGNGMVNTPCLVVCFVHQYIMVAGPDIVITVTMVKRVVIITAHHDNRHKVVKHKLAPVLNSDAKAKAFKVLMQNQSQVRG